MALGKRGLIYGIYARLPKELVEVPHELNKMVTSLFNDYKREQFKLGLKLMNPTIQFSEQDGDSFIKNEIALMIRCNLYKMSRLISRNVDRNRNRLQNYIRRF